MRIASLECLENSSLLSICILPCPKPNGSYHKISPNVSDLKRTRTHGSSPPY